MNHPLRAATAAIVFSSIAFSALITLNLIYFGGLTLNVLTLMGLAMGFGLVIDNAVVVLENIYRRVRPGEDPAAAAERGAREMLLPVLAATATSQRPVSATVVTSCTRLRRQNQKSSPSISLAR